MPIYSQTFDMALRSRGMRYERTLSLPVSRHTFERPDQIFRVNTFGRSTSRSSKRYSNHLRINSVNPILSPPSFSTFTFTHTPKAEAVSTSTPTMEAVSAVGSFPSPMPSFGTGSLGVASYLGSKMSLSSSVKKLLLSAVPGFFGLMGLGQLYEKRRKTGSLFLGAGAALSFFSSWYTILPERIYAFVSGGAAVQPYALTWMARFTGYNATLGEISIMLLAFVPALWALQVYDSISPIAIASQVARASKPMSAGPSIPMAAPMMANADGQKTSKDAEDSVKKLAKDLMKTSSLFSYLWER